MRDLLAELGLITPIIQAPMAGVSTPELAAAVSNAGGLGSIAVGAGNADKAYAAIAATRHLTHRPFNVNVFCHQPATVDEQSNKAWLNRLRPFFDEFSALTPTQLTEIYQSFTTDTAMQAALIDCAPSVVSLHFGLPEPAVIRALQNAGSLVFATATSLVEARTCQTAGVDAVVVQGIEAGGHRGCFDPNNDRYPMTTRDLLLATASATDLPLIAAGGIMTGADIAASLSAGAQMAQLGTAFVTCPETMIDESYRTAMLAAKETVVTNVISGRPARRLRSAFTDWGVQISHGIPDYPIAYDAGKALHGAAKAKGVQDFAAHWAGTGAPQCRALPAAELIEVLTAEFKTAVKAD